VLTANRDACLLPTSYNNVVDEAGEGGDAANEEGGDSAPVAGELGRVTVDTVEVVHIGYGNSSATDDIVTTENILVDMDVVGGGLCKGLTQS
jgi:hypothetical protein